MKTNCELNEVELTEAFEYLDELRESGRTNMFGAPAYVREELGWARDEADEATKLWVQTFSHDLSIPERVTKAMVRLGERLRKPLKRDIDAALSRVRADEREDAK